MFIQTHLRPLTLQLAAFALPLFVLSPLTAQRPMPGQSPQTPETQTPGTNRAANTDQETDRILATWAQTRGRVLVETAKVAAEQCKDPQVKQFAKDMVQQHEQCLEKLSKITGMQPQGNVTAGDMRRDGAGEARTAEASGRRPDEQGGDIRPAGGARGGMGFDHVQLLRDLSQKHIETATKMLREAQGMEVDYTFLGMQLVGHKGNIDANEVFAQKASPELAGILRQENEKLREEAKRLETLMEQLEAKKKDSAGGHERGAGAERGNGR